MTVCHTWTRSSPRGMCTACCSDTTHPMEMCHALWNINLSACLIVDGCLSGLEHCTHAGNHLGTLKTASSSQNRESASGNHEESFQPHKWLLMEEGNKGEKEKKKNASNCLCMHIAPELAIRPSAVAAAVEICIVGAYCSVQTIPGNLRGAGWCGDRRRSEQRDGGDHHHDRYQETSHLDTKHLKDKKDHV